MTPSEILEHARALHRSGAPEAESRYRDALERDPGLHAAWDGIGMIAHAARRFPHVGPGHAVARVEAPWPLT